MATTFTADPSIQNNIYGPVITTLCSKKEMNNIMKIVEYLRQIDIVSEKNKNEGKHHFLARY